MNGLLYCAEILGLLLIIKQSEQQQTLSYLKDSLAVTPTSSILNGTDVSDIQNGTSATLNVTDVSSTISGLSETEGTVQQSTSPSVSTQATTSPPIFLRKECLPVLMVCGGLIIACAILLILTLVLLGKVCQMSRRLKTLSTNDDLISITEYNVGMTKKNKSNSAAKTKETEMLMADASPASQEMSNGTAKEDGGTVDEDGQVGEDMNVGDSPNSEETPRPESESSPSSKQQEEAADAEPTADTAVASSAEGTEEPKHVM